MSHCSGEFLRELHAVPAAKIDFIPGVSPRPFPGQVIFRLLPPSQVRPQARSETHNRKEATSPLQPERRHRSQLPPLNRYLRNQQYQQWHGKEKSEGLQGLALGRRRNHWERAD